jgi:hypothetical protein
MPFRGFYDDQTPEVFMSHEQQLYPQDRAGKENITAEDVYWAGEDGQVDSEAILRKHGYDPAGPLELLLMSIIAKHPDHHRTPQERLSMGLDALIGQRRTGRRPNDDYDLLLEVAWQYFTRSFGGEERIDLAPIIRDCLASHSGATSTSHRRSIDGENSEVKRLKRKFEKQKDLLLVRVTAEMDPDRMDMVRAVRRIASALQRLGVDLDPTVIRVRLRRGQNPA